MPTYEYKCTKCGHHFEVFQKISESPITKCPKCGGAVERLISGGAGLIFKGSGFYITDYKKTGQKKEPTKEPAQKESKEKSDSTPKTTTDPAKPKAKSSD
jgi:putative FmdB family regulatory protein